MLINNYVPAAAGRSPEAIPLFWWQGWSCSWYVSSVFSIAGFDCQDPGAFVVVRREPNGHCTPLFVGTAENVGEALFTDYGDALMRAIKAGASEVHVHLAASTALERDDVRDDIAKGWHLPARSTATA